MNFIHSFLFNEKMQEKKIGYEKIEWLGLLVFYISSKIIKHLIFVSKYMNL